MKCYYILKVAPLLVLNLLACNNNQPSQKFENREAIFDIRSEDTTFRSMEGNSCISISAEDNFKFQSRILEVKGDVKFPLFLTVDSLKLMKVEIIENFKVICSSGATQKDVKSCKGVLLKNILEKSVINQLNHKDRNFYIVARASDNYKATFSWAELFNNPTGDQVFVLFEVERKPIFPQGDMILICKNDIKTGPRHVYWLKSIEVNRVD
ncbi:MAG: hypothetical protein IT267_03485 [Saprospiraceae bacterium]|nr:hypothetical protein [Saprospiraceae bacterium]